MSISKYKVHIALKEIKKICPKEAKVIETYLDENETLLDKIFFELIEFKEKEGKEIEKNYSLEKALKNLRY